ASRLRERFVADKAKRAKRGAVTYSVGTVGAPTRAVSVGRGLDSRREGATTGSTAATGQASRGLAHVRTIVLFGVPGPVPAASPAKPPVPAVIALGDATVAALPRWSVEQRADRVTFTDPDRALRVTIMANAGADAATAIAAAWQVIEPGFALAPGEPDEAPDS